MFAATIAVIVTGVLVCAAAIVLRFERARGERYASGARTTFDRLIFETKERLVFRYGAMSVRSVRQTIHFMLHQLLTILLRIIAYVERLIRSVVHLNKRQANKDVVKTTGSSSTSHLSAIADHKRGSKLSEEEQRAAKERALRG